MHPRLSLIFTLAVVALAPAAPLGCGGGGNSQSGGSAAGTGSSSGSTGTSSGTSGDDGGGTTTTSSGGSASSSGASSGTSGGSGTGSSSGSEGGAPQGSDAATDASGPLDASVLAVMRKVADYQLSRSGIDGIDWIHGAMWTGIMATYRATGDARYLTAIATWGNGNSWGLTGGVTTNADNQCVAQTYLDTYLLSPSAANMNMVSGAKPSFDAMVTSGNTGWTWEDALFMSPAGLTRLGAIENDPRYFQLLDANWSKAYTSLFVPADGLMCRDPNCAGTYWGRGNGWVLAGTARVLEYLPATDPQHASYVTLLNTMAAALEPWQGTDGMWRSDITHPARFPNPETSGTAFITFGIAWGVNNGLLDAATYTPVARSAWKGLVSVVDANGMVGYVQPVGAAPGVATATDTAPYGVGGFLLAGSEMARLGP
jgi:rhamnogalacturonyl hydrolase YesR